MIIIDRKKCDDCGTCVSVCSANASQIVDMLEINQNICTSCGVCVMVCPFAALKLERIGNRNKNENK